MTSSDDLTIDLRSTAPGAKRGWPGSGAVDHGAGAEAEERERVSHVLRLALDLQLDAMLMTLGAAAAQEARPDMSLSETGATVLPWARWLAEDLALTQELTATALHLDAALPAALGPAGEEGAAHVVEHLIARYESLTSLLEDVLARSAGSPHAPNATADPPLREALSRCSARLEELYRHEPVRVAVSQAERVGNHTTESWDPGMPVRGHRPLMHPQDRDATYLPGELLG